MKGVFVGTFACMVVGTSAGVLAGMALAGEPEPVWDCPAEDYVVVIDHTCRHVDEVAPTRDEVGLVNTLVSDHLAIVDRYVDAHANELAQQAAARLATESGPSGCVLTHSSDEFLRQLLPNLDAEVTRYGENIACATGQACDASTAPALMKAYQESPPHWEAINDPTLSHFGVGVACNEDTAFTATEFWS